MSKNIFSNLGHYLRLDKQHYDILKEEQPGAIPAIIGLLQAGETPDRISKAMLKKTGSITIANTIYYAASYIQKEGLHEDPA